LDVLFPPTNEELLLRKETPGAFIRLRRPVRIAGCVALSEYIEPSVRAAITENKFRHNTHAAKLLAALLSDYLAAMIGPLALTPIPLGSRRRRERGYNQVERILKHVLLPEGRPFEIVHLLYRARETEPQLSLPRARRLKNMQRAFAWSGDATALKGVRVVLVDDVVTTGATMRAARAALLPHLPPESTLTCVALAH
jgi:ComF family protein